MKKNRRRQRRFTIIWWGFPFRFGFRKYLPNFPIFDSIDIGPIEIRRFYRAKFKYPTSGPLITIAKRLEDRGKIFRKEKRNG
jgi:hypothetical protein